MLDRDGGTQSLLAEAQIEAAAARIARRRSEREAKIEILDEGGGIAAADSPERIAARVDRLSRHWSRAPLPTEAVEAPSGSAEEILAAALGRATWGDVPEEEVSLENAGKILERVVGTPDFVGINYLETALLA